MWHAAVQQELQASGWCWPEGGAQAQRSSCALRRQGATGALCLAGPRDCKRTVLPAPARPAPQTGAQSFARRDLLLTLQVGAGLKKAKLFGKKLNHPL